MNTIQSSLCAAAIAVCLLCAFLANSDPTKPRKRLRYLVAYLALEALWFALEWLMQNLSFDCGQVLNRDAVLAQLQGGMIFGLNMSLNEELTVKDGRIVEGNFDQYRILRMSETPRDLHVHFGALSGHERLTEIGEPPVGPIGPAIANAIYRATGKRTRTTPLRKHDLRWTNS